eukprot:sb/3476348/
MHAPNDFLTDKTWFKSQATIYVSLRWQAQWLPFPPKALPETQLYVLWVFRLKTRISEGYSVAPFHPIYLKFGIYTRLGVFNLSLKFQVSISSGFKLQRGSHLLKIQCNRHAHTHAHIG